MTPRLTTQWTENPKACRDAESACSDWAEKGECNKNPGFMAKSCRLSCRLCTAPEVKASDYAAMQLVLNTSLGQVRGGRRRGGCGRQGGAMGGGDGVGRRG